MRRAISDRRGPEEFRKEIGYRNCRISQRRYVAGRPHTVFSRGDLYTLSISEEIEQGHGEAADPNLINT